MKNARISDAGKILIAAFATVAGAVGGGTVLFNALQPEPVTEQTAPAGVNALVGDLSAAVSAEAKAKLAEAEANAAKPAVVRAACGELSALMAQLTASGITTKITVTPYEEPTDYFEFGYCKLDANDETVTFINDGDELSSPDHRRYIINELIEKLPPADILKLNDALNKRGPQP